MPFYLACFHDFVFIFFSNLTMMYQSVVFFIFILLWVHQTFDTFQLDWANSKPLFFQKILSHLFSILLM